MNDAPNNPDKPTFPPVIPGPTQPQVVLPPLRPKRPDAFDLEKMPNGVGLGAIVEALLKKPGSALFEMADGGRRGRLMGSLAVITALGLLLFGLIAGTFSGGTQLWASPLKIVVGVLFSALICFPSFYIFCCLSGLDIRFSTALGLVGGLTGLTALLLAGFSPVAWVFSQSTQSLFFMGMILVGVWVLAVGFGLTFIIQATGRLGASRPFYMQLWSMLFVLVTFQMSCALRPLLGKSDSLLPEEKKFFMQHWMDSASEGKTRTGQ